MSKLWPAIIAPSSGANGPEALRTGARYWPLLLLLGACQSGDLQLADAWVRAAPDGRALGAAYLDLRNEGPDISLVAVSSDVHAMASFHETVLIDGAHRMRAVEALEIGAGERLSLAPGGLHIMLMRAARELRAGDLVELRFEAVDGRQFLIEATVRREAP